MYGYVGLYCYFQYWRKRNLARIKLFLIFIAYFPAIELLQFIIVSRTSDINDIISGYFGIILGTALLFSIKKKSWFEPENEVKIRIDHFKGIIVAYVFYIFLKGLSPFDFSFDLEVISAGFQIRTLVPFYSYFKVTSIWNIYDVIETLFLTMPIGVVIAIKFIETKSTNSISKYSVYIGILFGLLIEGAQLFSPSRTGDITDVFFTVFGAILGAQIYKYYYGMYVNKYMFEPL